MPTFEQQTQRNTAEIARLEKRLEIMERILDSLLFVLGQEVRDGMILHFERQKDALDAAIVESENEILKAWQVIDSVGGRIR